jgi:hypothetical protein
MNAAPSLSRRWPSCERMAKSKADGASAAGM